MNYLSFLQADVMKDHDVAELNYCRDPVVDLTTLDNLQEGHSTDVRALQETLLSLQV